MTKVFGIKRAVDNAKAEIARRCRTGTIDMAALGALSVAKAYLTDPNAGDLEPTTAYRTLDQSFGEAKFCGGHQQSIVGVASGVFAAGGSWADGLGNRAVGSNSGAFCKAADAGLVTMNDIAQIWKSKLTPEGPMVVRPALPQDAKTRQRK